METAYYVTHPSIDRTAVVFAPSTEKARTTFLDWLERNNLIRRSDRQLFRRDMVAERMEDPNVPADVVLHYGYEEGSTIRYKLPITEEGRRLAAGESPEEVYYPKLTEEEERLADEEERDMAYREALPKGEPKEEPEPKPIELPRPRGMPIQQVMLRGYAE